MKSPTSIFAAVLCLGGGVAPAQPLVCGGDYVCTDDPSMVGAAPHDRPQVTIKLERAAVLRQYADGHALAADFSDESHGKHGRGHDELHNWYKTLRQPGTGYECCDNKDCRPTSARLRETGVEVLVDGEWTKVPPNTIIDIAPPDLQSHVCAPKGPWSPKPIFCVVLGFGV